MPSRSTQNYRMKAEEVRTLAARVLDQVLRRQLLAIASDYEYLAECIENLEHCRSDRSLDDLEP